MFFRTQYCVHWCYVDIAGLLHPFDVNAIQCILLYSFIFIFGVWKLLGEQQKGCHIAMKYEHWYYLINLFCMKSSLWFIDGRRTKNNIKIHTIFWIYIFDVYLRMMINISFQGIIGFWLGFWGRFQTLNMFLGAGLFQLLFQELWFSIALLTVITTVQFIFFSRTLWVKSVKLCPLKGCTFNLCGLLPPFNNTTYS